MSSIVRAAVIQSEWTGDKESMVEKNIGYARDAADQGTQVLCFQEIFNTSYFCNVQDPQYYDEAEEIYRDLCLFDEHTWGSADSVGQPGSLETWGQYKCTPGPGSGKYALHSGSTAG